MFVPGTSQAVFAALSSLLLLAGEGNALENGLARTPPMGWNSWNAVRCAVNETIVKAAADNLVSSGLAAAGYQYIVLDDCWQQSTRALDGSLRAHPTKFPSGIKALATYVRSKGLKFGLYGSPGTRTCAMIYDGYPGIGLGSKGHEQQDANTWASWGVEYLKYDWCLADQDGLSQQPAFTKMRDAIAATGKKITYSISEYGYTKPWTWGAPIANLWRTTGDIGPTWGSVANIIESQAALAGTSAPGAWNDPDMLQIGNGAFTPAETRSHVAMWAMLAAPLMVGTLVDRLPQSTLDVLRNPRLIAIDQDALGKQAARVQQTATTNGVDLWVRELSGGRQAIAILNASGATQSVTLNLGADCGLTDVWTGNNVTHDASGYTIKVASHDTAVFTRTSTNQVSIASSVVA